MKIYSKFAMAVTLFGLISIIFSFYQWAYFLPSVESLGKFPDPSQFFIGIIIGLAAIIYARDIWDRARKDVKQEERDNKQREWEEKHLKQHNEIMERFEQFNMQAKELRDLSNQVTHQLFEEQQARRN